MQRISLSGITKMFSFHSNSELANETLSLTVEQRKVISDLYHVPIDEIGDDFFSDSNIKKRQRRSPIYGMKSRQISVSTTEQARKKIERKLKK